MITLEQAKTLSQGTMLYSTVSFNKRGEPHRAKVTRVITWKTRPHQVQVNWKHGLYEYGTMTQDDLSRWALTEEEAKAERGASSATGNTPNLQLVRGPVNNCFIWYSPINQAYIFMVGEKQIHISDDKAAIIAHFDRVAYPTLAAQE